MVIIQNKISTNIIEKLRLQRNKIVSKDEIFKIIKEYQKIYKKKVNFLSIWTYLRKSNYIKRILGDYYYVYSLDERYHQYCQYSEEELVFLVLEKMKIKWYLGLERALRENKIGWQALNIIPIINTHFSGIKKFGNSTFKFIKTQKKMFMFGMLTKKTNNKVPYFYADREKTYLDFLYFSSYAGKDVENVREQLAFKLNRSVVKTYTKRYSKKIQEVG